MSSGLHSTPENWHMLKLNVMITHEQMLVSYQVSKGNLKLFVTYVSGTVYMPPFLPSDYT